jgi:hypothetical protein
MWHVISTAPFDRDLELALVDANGVHAIFFPCRRVLGGWIKAKMKTPIKVSSDTLARLGERFLTFLEWSRDRCLL